MLVLRTSYFFFLVGMVIVVATLIIKAVMNEHETVENRIAFVIGAGMGMVYAWRLIIRCLTYIIFDVFFVGEFKLPVYYIVTLFDRIVYLASFISFAIIWDLVVVNYVFPGEGWSDMDDLFHGSIYNDVYLIALSGITFASAYVLGQFAITGIVREYFTGTFWEKMKAQVRRSECGERSESRRAYDMLLTLNHSFAASFSCRCFALMHHVSLSSLKMATNQSLR